MKVMKPTAGVSMGPFKTAVSEPPHMPTIKFFLLLEEEMPAGTWGPKLIGIRVRTMMKITLTIKASKPSPLRT